MLTGLLLRRARVCAVALLALAPAGPAAARAHPNLRAIAPFSLADLRAWGDRVQSMVRSGNLRVRQTRPDMLVPGRVIERSDQYYRGVRVFGADVARQFDRGLLVSVFGNVYQGIDISTDPALPADEARARIVELAGVEQGPSRQPELVVLPLDGGGYQLAWRMRAVTRGAEIIQYFLDAATGRVVLQYSDRQTQSAVGRARGVLGDRKKISVEIDGPGFIASDELRPPEIITFDLKGDPFRALDFLNGQIALGNSDVAADADNDWTDGAVDDAHVYAGFTYDYYFKRFNRRGLDNEDIRIVSLAHPVRRRDLFEFIDVVPDFFVNAFYAGGGVMVYGVGLPPGFTLGGQTWDFLSGGLDVVAHELTHGVTEYTSRLIYRNESGALNESFSDMMGTSVEFFFQPAGDGPQRAEYLIGEDVIRPDGLRSMSNPASVGDPDHYSKRFTGAEDNGGVHVNSAIPNQAFYLAIEGGTNRTSGMTVAGVGGGNREQIEKVFYRAFTQLLPADATFSMARAATIQASRDLYGAGSAAERAVIQAWTAVGVE